MKGCQRRANRREGAEQKGQGKKAALHRHPFETGVFDLPFTPFLRCRDWGCCFCEPSTAESVPSAVTTFGISRPRSQAFGPGSWYLVTPLPLPHCCRIETRGPAAVVCGVQTRVWHPRDLARPTRNREVNTRRPHEQRTSCGTDTA